MIAVETVTTKGETAVLCQSIGVSRASLYRRRHPARPPTPRSPPAPSPRALVPAEEAQFRTFKYRPGFPDRFGSLENARAISHDLLAWYNDVHHHSGLRYLTPADVHYGRAAAMLEVRHRARLAAYAAHPERFVQGPPRPELLPTAVWINPPPKTTCQDDPGTANITPDDPKHGVFLR